MMVHSMVESRTQTVSCNSDRLRFIISSIFNNCLQKMQFRVKPSAVGSVIALQPAVRVCIFVFVGVLKGPGEYPDTHLSQKVVCFCIYSRSVCMLMSFMRLFAGLWDVSSPRQYILFIICWAAALLRLCCPARFYLPFSRLGAAGECSKRDAHRSCDRPCGKWFEVVVVCSD